MKGTLNTSYVSTQVLDNSTIGSLNGIGISEPRSFWWGSGGRYTQRAGIPDTYPPVLTSSGGHQSRRHTFYWYAFSFVFFFIFMQLSGKIGQYSSLALPPLGLAPPTPIWGILNLFCAIADSQFIFYLLLSGRKR